MTATAVATPPSGTTAVPDAPKKFNWGNLATGVVMAIIIIWCLVPFYWMLVLSFRDSNFTFDNTPWFNHFTFSNFKYAFDSSINPFARSLLNSVIIGGTVTIVSSTAGFGWPARLDVICDLLATETFEEGAAWFKAHPQQGNAYNFSKEVTTVYTMSMALMVAQKGFRINAVLPGPVQTPILADFEDSMGKDALDGLKALLGRHATPDDIAGAIVFLASDAARWINGHPLVVDGGATGAVLTGVIPAPEI